MLARASARRKRYSVREKLNILDLTRTWTLARAAAAYGVSHSAIAQWRAREADFRRQDSACEDAITGAGGSAERSPTAAPLDGMSSRPSSEPPHVSSDPPHGLNAVSPTSPPPIDTRTAARTAPATSTPSLTDAPLASETPASLGRLLPPDAPTVLIGFAGLRSTVADVAVRSFFPLLQVGVARRAGQAVETVGFAHVVDAMDAVVRREVEYCVVPTGWLLSVSASFALAEFASRPLRIVAEILSKPPLCLSTVSGTALRNCRCVLSDAGLLQAHEPLILDMEAQRDEPIVRQAAWDSAGACISVQEQGSRGVAVLATEQAARAAGLHVLVDGIHDADADVNARFLVLGRPGCAAISPCPRAALPVRAVRKTTVLASMHNEPACLASILRVFADASVPVLAIQTRLLSPWPTSRMHAHQMLVSFLATEQRAQLSALLERLNELAVSQHVLGTYFSMAVAAAAASAATTATAAPSTDAA